MRPIELPGKGFNVDEIFRFAEGLKENFSPVRIRFYRAEFKYEDSLKPTHVFREAPERANYVTVHLNGRDAIEYYKKKNGSGGALFDNNFSDAAVQAILGTLLKHRMRNIPSPKIKIMPKIEPVEKPLFSKIFDFFRQLFSLFRSRS